MEIHCETLLYLDRRRLLDDMKIKCKEFLKELSEKPLNKFLSFRYLLEVDVMKLLDEFPDLGKMLLEEPLAWNQIVSDILYSCLQTLIHDADSQVDPAQVAVILRLCALPRILCHPNQHYNNGLVSFKGILIHISKPTSYVYHTVWSCPEQCEGNEVVLHYTPKSSPKCCICRSVLFENSGMRRCGEKVKATFLLTNDKLAKTFVIVDDLMSKLKEGSMYILAGYVIKKLTTIWLLEKVMSIAAPITCVVPIDIQKLFQVCDGLSWKFIYCLASSLGANVCPLNCLMHLKISLLLSLASIKANILTGSSILHLLVAGFDTSIVGDIMTEASKLAERRVILGTTNTSVSTALIGSSGGVCAMTLPLHTYSTKQTSSILSAIECNEITTENGKVNLRSAVWAQGMDLRKVVLYNVASVFGFVCRGDYGEHSDEMVDFVLQNAVDPLETSEEEIQALKDVKHYLDLVAGIPVSIDKRAERILRGYFLAARKESPRGVSVGSMSALVSASLTSARLCRRSIANVEDAVFAIWLHVSGSPEPRFAPEEYIQTPADVKKLHKIMDGFKEWLEQFIGSIISVM